LDSPFSPPSPSFAGPLSYSASHEPSDGYDSDEEVRRAIELSLEEASTAQQEQQRQEQQRLPPIIVVDSSDDEGDDEHSSMDIAAPYTSEQEQCDIERATQNSCATIIIDDSDEMLQRAIQASLSAPDLSTAAAAAAAAITTAPSPYSDSTTTYNSNNNNNGNGNTTTTTTYRRSNNGGSFSSTTITTSNHRPIALDSADTEDVQTLPMHEAFARRNARIFGAGLAPDFTSSLSEPRIIGEPIVHEVDDQQADDDQLQQAIAMSLEQPQRSAPSHSRARGSKTKPTNRTAVESRRTRTTAATATANRYDDLLYGLSNRRTRASDPYGLDHSDRHDTVETTEQRERREFREQQQQEFEASLARDQERERQERERQEQERQEQIREQQAQAEAARLEQLAALTRENVVARTKAVVDQSYPSDSSDAFDVVLILPDHTRHKHSFSRSNPFNSMSYTHTQRFMLSVSVSVSLCRSLVFCSSLSRW
jgi:hypothetical protein